VNFNIHKATAKPVTYINAPHKKYRGVGDITLVNSLRGSRNFNDGNWQGFEGENLELIIDLMDAQQVDRVSVGCLHETGSWVFLPKGITILASDDGQTYTEVGSTSNNVPLQSEALVMDFSVDLHKVNTRYLKVVVLNQQKVPAWHSAAGNSSWLFVDEIIVE